jgi:hypothetical protein
MDFDDDDAPPALVETAINADGDEKRIKVPITIVTGTDIFCEA